jgi:hypothetical protein
MAGYFADCIKSFCIVYLTRMVWDKDLGTNACNPEMRGDVRAPVLRRVQFESKEVYEGHDFGYKKRKIDQIPRLRL